MSAETLKVMQTLKSAHTQLKRAQAEASILPINDPFRLRIDAAVEALEAGDLSLLVDIMDDAIEDEEGNDDQGK